MPLPIVALPAGRTPADLKKLKEKLIDSRDQRPSHPSGSMNQDSMSHYPSGKQKYFSEEADSFSEFETNSPKIPTNDDHLRKNIDTFLKNKPQDELAQEKKQKVLALIEATQKFSSVIQPTNIFSRLTKNRSKRKITAHQQMIRRYAREIFSLINELKGYQDLSVLPYIYYCKKYIIEQWKKAKRINPKIAKIIDLKTENSLFILEFDEPKSLYGIVRKDEEKIKILEAPFSKVSEKSTSQDDTKSNEVKKEYTYLSGGNFGHVLKETVTDTENLQKTKAIKIPKNAAAYFAKLEH